MGAEEGKEWVSKRRRRIHRVKKKKVEKCYEGAIPKFQQVQPRALSESPEYAMPIKQGGRGAG